MKGTDPKSHHEAITSRTRTESPIVSALVLSNRPILIEIYMFLNLVIAARFGQAYLGSPSQ